MIIALVVDLELYMALLIVGYWLGREYNQAEMRYMKIKGINRSKLGFFDGLKFEAWDRDSLVNDLVLPIMVAILIIIIGVMI